MDPIANLIEQREIAKRILDEPLMSDDAASRLAELVIALDEWRLMGGWDPYDKAGSLVINEPYAGTD